MRRRVIIATSLFLITGLVVSLAMLFRPFDGGPRYKAMPVAYWSRAIKEEFRDASSLSRKVEDFLGLYTRGQPAVLNGDPNAVPVLLRLRAEEDVEVRIRADIGLLRVVMGPYAKEAILA